MIRMLSAGLTAFVIAFLLIAAPCAPALAHSMNFASAQVELNGAHATVQIMFDGTRVPSLDENKDGLVSQGELNASVEEMYRRLKAALSFTGPAAPEKMTLTRYEVTGEQDVLLLVLDLEFAGPVQNFEVTGRMSALLDQPAPLIVTLAGPGVGGEAVIKDDGDVARFQTARPTLDVFQSFSLMGIEHIFTGYDHLAFLMCLLLGATSVRSLIWTITAFTLAHSVTLSLATLNIVHVPGPIVETAIAATIIYVAVENLVGSRLVKRPLITGAFGLIHGFGFASALQEVGIPSDHIVLSLFSFNLGVEFGQLVFIGVGYVLLGKFVTSKRLRTAVSIVTICIALFWFIQRVALVI